MKEITVETLHDFVSTLEIELISTHPRLSVPIIKRIYAKMMHGLKFGDILVCDNLIINGHHRYLSALLANRSIDTSTTLKASSTKTYDWKNVEFIKDDFDTPELIEKHNRDDADFNNVPLEKIYEMTK